jgi:hypothetical protein
VENNVIEEMLYYKSAERERLCWEHMEWLFIFIYSSNHIFPKEVAISISKRSTATKDRHTTEDLPSWNHKH